MYLIKTIILMSHHNFIRNIFKDVKNRSNLSTYSKLIHSLVSDSKINIFLKSY